eukprot:GEMP01003207.1.p1 GENE.GEMP01003207.1~~GEMP01003207.1.p1  ORF type:complete len:1075 (+),score=220.59 GEMP01003207.1:97-3321(+)
MEVRFTRSESGLPVVSSLPSIFLTDNAKVVNYFSAKGRKQWGQTSLTLLLKTPAAWNSAYSTSHTDAMLCKKGKHTIVQPRLPQLVRQCNAQRAKGLDDERCRKEAENKPTRVEGSFVDNYFVARLFPIGVDAIPKQISLGSLVPRSSTPPLTAHLDASLEPYLRRCAGFYAAASQHLMTNSTIYLHRSTFCRFILDCQLAHVHRLPYVMAVEMGFERWKRVASGGESGKTGLEMLELPHFSQSVGNLVRVHYPTEKAEYFYHQDGVGTVPQVIGPLLRYAEERIPYCQWIDERYGKRCNKIPAVEERISMSWQRRMVRNMLIEPAVIHLITAYRWVFTALFESYAIDGHVSQHHFLRFCRDFDLLPTMGARQLFVSAYNNSECVGAPLVPPEHQVIQKLALRPMRDHLPAGTTWEMAWQKLFGKEVTAATYEMWDQALLREMPGWGIITRQLTWDALILQPDAEDYIAPWLRTNGSRASTPSSTFSDVSAPVLLSTAFIKTFSSMWPITSAPSAQSTERDVDRPPAERQRRKSMPDLWTAGVRKITAVKRLTGLTRNLSPDNNMSDPSQPPPDIVDFILYLMAEHHNVHEAWNALLVEAEENELEDEGASPWSMSPLSSHMKKSGSPKRGSQPHVSSPTAAVSSSRSHAVPPLRQPKKDAITEAAFVRLVVPNYTHSQDYATALFHHLCKNTTDAEGDTDGGEEKKKSSRMLNRRHTAVGLGLPVRPSTKPNKAVIRALTGSTSPTNESPPNSVRALTIKNLRLAARECANRSKYSSASVEPTSPAVAKVPVKRKDAIPPEAAFGLASFTEALCTAVLTHLSFYSSEVHQNTSSVNKLCVLLSHMAQCVKEHPPWNDWTPSASPTHRGNDGRTTTTKAAVYSDDGEVHPGSQKTRNSRSKWSDEFFPEDQESFKRRVMRNDERTWATHKRILWALQRLDSIDLQDPTMFTPLLSPRPNTTRELDETCSISQCTCPRTPAGWGNPTCAHCCCVSRALLLQVYPLRELIGTPNLANIPALSAKMCVSVAEAVPSPFTTLTAFRPKTVNRGKEAASPASRRTPVVETTLINTTMFI